MGGHDCTADSDKVYHYDTRTDTWSELEPLANGAVRDHGCTATYLNVKFLTQTLKSNQNYLKTGRETCDHGCRRGILWNCPNPWSGRWHWILADPDSNSGVQGGRDSRIAQPGKVSRNFRQTVEIYMELCFRALVLLGGYNTAVGRSPQAIQVMDWLDYTWARDGRSRHGYGHEYWNAYSVVSSKYFTGIVNADNFLSAITDIARLHLSQRVGLQRLSVTK